MIPLQYLSDFVQSLLVSSTVKDDWVIFYLRQLLNIVNSSSHGTHTSDSGEAGDQDTQTSRALYTSLSKESMQRLQAFCSESFAGSVQSINVMTRSLPLCSEDQDQGIDHTPHYSTTELTTSSERMEVDPATSATGLLKENNC